MSLNLFVYQYLVHLSECLGGFYGSSSSVCICQYLVLCLTPGLGHGPCSLPQAPALNLYLPLLPSSPPSPQFVFTGTDPNFLFTGSGLIFVYWPCLQICISRPRSTIFITSRGPEFAYTGLVFPIFIYLPRPTFSITGPGPEFSFTLLLVLLAVVVVILELVVISLE